MIINSMYVTEIFFMKNIQKSENSGIFLYLCNSLNIYLNRIQSESHICFCLQCLAHTK